MDDEKAIYEHWERYKDIIKDYYISPIPHEIRWITRNGEKVLQQSLLVNIYFSKDIFKYGDFTNKDMGYIWFDVPILEE
jgi:hypothetical protein